MTNPVEVAGRLLPAGVRDALAARFGARLSTALAVREQHGRDESPFDVPPPDAVVFAESTEDVAFVVKLANEHRVPVIPYGAGSSLEGHLLAVQGGISIDVSRMDQVLRINAEDLTVTVQAGVLREQLNREVRDTGLFFPIDRQRRQQGRIDGRRTRRRERDAGPPGARRRDPVAGWRRFADRSPGTPAAPAAPQPLRRHPGTSRWRRETARASVRVPAQRRPAA